MADPTPLTSETLRDVAVHYSDKPRLHQFLIAHADRMADLERENDRLLSAPAPTTPDLAALRCVCQVDDQLVREWVQKARAIAQSKGFTLPPLARTRTQEKG